MPSYHNILRCGPGTNPGHLDAGADAVTWVSPEGIKVAVPYANLRAATWYDLGKACQLWLADNAGELFRYDGFKLTDFDALAKAVGDGSKGAIKLSKRTRAAAGQTWGTVRVIGTYSSPSFFGRRMLVAATRVGSLLRSGGFFVAWEEPPYSIHLRGREGALRGSACSTVPACMPLVPPLRYALH